MKKSYQLYLAKRDNIDGWMNLVNEVADNFPGLEINEYLKILIKNIDRQTAICVRHQDSIVGVLLFSVNSKCLSCMAVHPRYWQQGIASAMVEKMISLFPDHCEIWVSTFRKGDPKGIAPRALYKKYGFIEDELTIEHGYPNQKFVLRK